MKDKLLKSKVEREALYLLIEECGEVVQRCTKILRFGWSSGHPDGLDDNQVELNKEINDLAFAVNLLIDLNRVKEPNAENIVGLLFRKRQYTLSKRLIRIIDNMIDEIKPQVINENRI